MINDKATTRKRNWLREVSAVVIISALLFVYYPVKLERISGTNGLTAHGISSVSLYMWPNPFTERGKIRLEDIADEAFIAKVLSLLSNHTMRRVYGNYRRHVAVNDYTMRADIVIAFEDDTEKWVRVDYDPRYVVIDNASGFTRYKLYGAGLDVKRLYEIAKGKEDAFFSIFSSPQSVSLQALRPLLGEVDWEVIRRLNERNNFDLLEYLAGAPDAEDHLDVYFKLAPAFDGAYAAMYGARISNIYDKDRQAFVKELAIHQDVRGLICSYIAAEYADHPDWSMVWAETEKLLGVEGLSESERETIEEIKRELENVTR